MYMPVRWARSPCCGSSSAAHRQTKHVRNCGRIGGGLCFLWVSRHFCEKNVLYGKNTSHHSTVVLHLSQGVLGSVRCMTWWRVLLGVHCVCQSSICVEVTGQHEWARPETACTHAFDLELICGHHASTDFTAVRIFMILHSVPQHNMDFI